MCWLTHELPRPIADGRLSNPAHGVVGLLLCGDSHLDEQRQPASLVVVQFKIDYVNADGGIAHYYPDFLVKLSPKKMIVVETKGFEDLDVPLQMERLRQWCEDINKTQSKVEWDYVFVDQKSWDKQQPTTFGQVLNRFRQYK